MTPDQGFQPCHFQVSSLTYTHLHADFFLFWHLFSTGISYFSLLPSLSNILDQDVRVETEQRYMSLSIQEKKDTFFYSEMKD